MTMDNKTKVFIFLPLALIIILAVSADYIPLIREWSGVELQVLEFTPDKLKVKELRKAQISRELQSPIDFKPAAVEPAVEPVAELEDELVQRFNYNDNSLSLIVISDKKKTAVINGKLFKEGDTINGTKIAVIEPGRVLLKNKSSQWLYVKEVK